MLTMPKSFTLFSIHSVTTLSSSPPKLKVLIDGGKKGPLPFNQAHLVLHDAPKFSFFLTSLTQLFKHTKNLVHKCKVDRLSGPLKNDGLKNSFHFGRDYLANLNLFKNDFVGVLGCFIVSKSNYDLEVHVLYACTL